MIRRPRQTPACHVAGFDQLPLWTEVGLATHAPADGGGGETTSVKSAVQPVLAVIVTVPVVQPVPVHPANVEPVTGTSVIVTTVPFT